MLTIEVHRTGTLEGKLPSEEWKRIKELKVKGPLNEADLKLLKSLPVNNMGFYLLDLFEANNKTNLSMPDLYERALSSYSVPDGVRKLRKGGLKCLSISLLNLPYSIEKIEIETLTGCPELKVINVDEKNEKYRSIDGLLYSKDGHKLIYCPPRREGTVELPDGVTGIAQRAFHWCDRLACVILPNSINHHHIGEGALDFANKRTEVHWTIDNEHYDMGETRYTQNGQKLERHTPDPKDYNEGDTEYDLLSKGEYDFVIPHGVTQIGKEAFKNCYQLKSIQIPNTVTTIGSGAFEGCTHLKAIVLPTSTRKIKGHCFDGCRNLGQICCWATTPPDCSDSIIDYTRDKMLYMAKGDRNKYMEAKGWKDFANMKEVEAMTYVKLTMANGEERQLIYSPTVLKGKMQDYIDTHWNLVCSASLTGTLSDEDISYLRQMATDGCLKNIDLRDCNREQIFPKAFEDATVLRNITLPKNMTSIPHGLLTGCKSLRKVILGKNTKEIGAIAFAECNMLKHIDLGNEVTCIGNGAFWNCYSLESAELNINIKTVGENAFRGCEGLRRINCHCSFPPICQMDTFPHSAFSRSILTIPANGRIDYSKAEVWQKFQNVIAEDMLF